MTVAELLERMGSFEIAVWREIFAAEDEAHREALEKAKG
jgi:hypothetical protein